MTLIRRYNQFPFFPAMFDDDHTKGNCHWPGSMHANASIPAVNINENEKEFTIEVAAPGMEKEDFKLELEDNVLSISSKKEEKKEEKDEQGKYTRREFSYSSFRRSFTIPEKTVNVEAIEAKYENGILAIVIPKKAEQANPNRLINVK